MGQIKISKWFKMFDILKARINHVWAARPIWTSKNCYTLRRDFGTPILPPSLDFFNNWSRDDSCSEKSYYSEPDSFQDELTPGKDNEVVGKESDSGKFNFKSSSDMSSFHRQASAKLSAVKQKLNLRHSEIFQDNDKNVDSKKRKSSLDESATTSSKKIPIAVNQSGESFLTKTDQNTTKNDQVLTEPASTPDKNSPAKDSTNIEPKSPISNQNMSLSALKEKYKKQLLEKKANPGVKPRQTSQSNEKENKKELSLKNDVSLTKKLNKISKMNAIKREQMKKSLEKRKSLRSARKINEMTPTYLEVSAKNQSSTRIRRAKLVPPIVEVDSDDSEYEEKIPLIQTKDSLKWKASVVKPPDSSTVKISNNLKHQMVLNQKPIVKLNNIALLCADHSYGKSSTNPATSIVIPKPKIITNKPGLALTSPCHINIKVERVSSVPVNHAATSASTTTWTKIRQAPLSPTYKPPNNIVIGESKRCTRSQKQKEINQSCKTEEKSTILTKKETLVEIKKEEDVKKSASDLAKKSTTKLTVEALASKRSLTRLAESPAKNPTTKSLESPVKTIKHSSSKLVETPIYKSAESSPDHSLSRLVESLALPSSKLIDTSKISLTKFIDSSVKISSTKLIENCAKKSSLKLIESPSKPSSTKLVESPAQPSSIKLVDSPAKPSSIKLVDSPAQPSSTKLIESPAQPSSTKLVESPAQPSTKLVESPAKSSAIKLDESPDKPSAIKLVESSAKPSIKLVECPAKPSSIKLVESPAKPSSIKLVESPAKPSSIKLVESPAKPSSIKLSESPAKLSLTKIVESRPNKQVASKFVESTPAKQSSAKLVEIAKPSSTKLPEDPNKVSPTKLVESPAKAFLSKISEKESKDALRDKVKPIVKQIKEDLMSQHKVISIDSTTEEESEDEARSSDDSFLLSSFVKSTIAKLKKDREIGARKDDDAELTKSKAKATLSKKNKSDKKSVKADFSKRSKTSNKSKNSSKSSSKKFNKKIRKSKKKSSKEFKISTTLDLLAIKNYKRTIISDSSSEEELLSSDSSISVILPRANVSVPSTSKEAANKSEETEQNSSTSYIIESVTRGTSNFDNISNEMAAATLPGELMFGTAEEIRGLMTSEFSGVFDENFPAGAILLTARDPLTQVPLHLTRDVATPTKTVVDASTQCEDDILSCSSDSSKDSSREIVEIISSSTSTSPEILSTSTILKKATLSTKTNINKMTTPETSITNNAKVKNMAKKAEPFPGPNELAKLVEAPVYSPTVEEFQDPLEFINRIRPEAEKYGICRIIPPSTFKPECKVNDDMRFTAHNQYIHKMLYRWGPNRQHVAAIRKHLSSQGIKMEHSPLIGGIEMDLARLYQTVQGFGGLKRVMEKKKWQKIADTLHIPKAAQDRVNKLYDAYCKYLVSYATLPKEEKQKLENEVVAQREESLRKKNERSKESANQEEDDDEEEDDDDEGNDCVTKGRSVSLSAFYRVARNTMSMWYRNQPLTEEVEKDYWKLVTERLNHVVVHAGNIDSSVYGSGFPTNRNSHVSKHPWNLKVLTNNPGSVLRSMGPVSGVTIPTLHVGMLFTTGCWYRDIHELPWIEYSHTGADKIWYSVPHSASQRFRHATTKIMPDACRDHPIWLPSDTAMVPPSLLIENGSPLCRTVQESGQFVVIFPSAFTSTICTGYVVSESVYFAPPSWLEMAQSSFQDIQNSCEPPVFSLERLLFAIANDGRTQTQTLIKLLPLIKHIRDRELCSRKQLFDIGLKVSERLALYSNKGKKRQQKGLQEETDHECEVCRMHCYISMVVNTRDDTTFCLEHGYQSVQKKEAKAHKLLFTYDQSELNELVRRVSDMIRSNCDKGGNASKKKPRKKLPGTP